MAAPQVEPELEDHSPELRRVLHIVESGGGQDDAMSCALRKSHIEAQICHDVYRGLARLSAKDCESYCAVLLCVDFLAEGEFDFFELARRYGRCRSLLVYSVTGSRRRIQNALSRGATHVVEADGESVRLALGTSLHGATSDVGERRSDERKEAEQTGWPTSNDSMVSVSDAASEVPDTPLRTTAEDPVEAITDRDEGPLLTPEEAEWLIFGRDGRDAAAAARKGAV